MGTIVRAVLSLVALLSGCVTVTPMAWDRVPPADWPLLRETVVVVSQAEIGAKCGAVYRSARSDKDCAIANFRDRACTIYLTRAYEPLLQHARGHCRGYDHPGETTMRDGWERFKTRSAAQ